jgi:F0F1-type ATP synthase membrane subunit b/b'
MNKATEQELSRAKLEIKKEITQKALLKANELVKEKLNKDAQINLINSFAVSLSKKASNN